MSSLDIIPRRKTKTNTQSEQLRKIKAKLDPRYFDLELHKINNELITDHVNDVNFILSNIEEIDWNAPVPFDRDEMWEETLQKTKLKGSPCARVIDTSVMAVARQKYSDYTQQLIKNKGLQSRYDNIAEKIDILRHSG